MLTENEVADLTVANNVHTQLTFTPVIMHIAVNQLHSCSCV